MTQVSRSKASLIITSYGLRPEYVSKLLGCDGTTMYSKGDTRIIKTSGREIKRKHGHWSLDAPEQEPENLNGQVAEIFGSLSNDPEVWNQLSNEYRILLYCGLFMESSNEAMQLSPHTLKEVSGRGVELFFDIYGCTEQKNA